MWLNTILVYCVMILGAAAVLGIAMTTVVPYFIEGRSLKRQKLYSILSFCLTTAFAGSLLNSWLSRNISDVDSLVVMQCDKLLLVVSLLFIFLQDGVTVFVGAAHASQNHVHVHDLLKLTITGASFTGLVLMMVMIMIYFMPPVFSLFVPDKAIQNAAAAYYILECLNLPFYFLRLMSIGFMLGVERLALWFKLQVAYVLFTAIWYSIFVWGAGLGAAGRASADLIGGLGWVIAILYLYKKEFHESYPITAHNIFTIENTGLIKDILISCGNLMTRDFFATMAATLPYILATVTSFGSDMPTNNTIASNTDSAIVYANTTTARAVVVMTICTLFFQGYAPYLAYIGRWRGSRLLCKPMGGKSREFRRLSLSLIVQGTIVGAISVMTAGFGRTIIPEVVISYMLDAPAEIPLVLARLKYVWWVLVCDVTATNLNGVYQSLVWAAKDFTYIRTITVTSFFFVYCPVLLVGFFYDSLITLWAANCCYTFFQLCCYSWRVHTRILTTPLHGDKHLLITWQLVRNGGTSLGLEALDDDDEDEEHQPYIKHAEELPGKALGQQLPLHHEDHFEDIELTSPRTTPKTTPKSTPRSTPKGSPRSTPKGSPRSTPKGSPKFQRKTSVSVTENAAIIV